MPSKKELIYLVPIYKERGQMELFLEKIKNAGRKEIKAIVFGENGSKDSEKECENLQSKFPSLNFYYSSTKDKGYGAGVKAAYHFIEQNLGGLSAHQNIVISAVDLPFAFSDLENVEREAHSDYEIYIGSKMHEKSTIKRTWKRLLATYIYFVSRVLLFRTKVKDSQGTFFVGGDAFKKIISRVTTNDFFFSTEFTLRAESMGYKIKEVPVVYIEDNSVRGSKVSLLNDSLKMFKQLIVLKMKIKNEKQRG